MNTKNLNLTEWKIIFYASRYFLYCFLAVKKNPKKKL